MASRAVSRGGKTAVLAVAGLALAFSLISVRPSTAIASRLQGNWGGGNTSVWVQNLDPRQPATVIARFYLEPGDPPDPPIEIVRRDVPPWGVARFDSPNAEGVPRAAGQLDQYALIVESDREVAILNFTEEPFTQAAVAYNDAPISNRVVVPLALRGFSKQEGGTEVSSMVSVESAYPTQRLRATFYSRLWYWNLQNRLREYASQPNRPVSISPSGRGEGGTWAIDFDDAVFDEGPKPERYEGSVGWVMLEAEPDNKVVSQSFVNLQTVNNSPTGFDSFAVSSFGGIPLEHRSNRLFVPLFRSRFFGITGISVVNPDPSRAVRLKATYFVSELSGPACQEQTGNAIAHRDATGTLDYVEIGPLENAVLYQFGREQPETTPPIRAPGSIGDPRLKPECFGSAVIEVDPSTPGSVVAMVNDFLVRPPVATADAYQAVRYEDTSSTIAVPMILHDGARPAGSLYPAAATGIQVMNVDESPADVTAIFVEPAGGFGNGGEIARQTQRVEPYRAVTFYTGAMPTISSRSGFEGSAVITSAGGQRLAVSVTIARAGKDTVTYNGVRAAFGSPISAVPRLGRLFAGLGGFAAPRSLSR